MLSRDQVLRPISRISSPLIDRTLKRLSFNEKLNRYLKKRNSKKLLQIGRLKKVLIIPDINIGDAMIGQSFIAPMKKAFPDIEISYIYQQRASPLVCTNPDIDEHFPLFRNIGYPSEKDFANLQNLLRGFHFDLIVNLNPYFTSKHFRAVHSPVIYSSRLISNIIRDYTLVGSEAHISLQMSKFAEELIEPLISNPANGGKINGDFHQICFYTAQSPFLRAQRMLEKLDIKSDSKIVFLNPDTSCAYTRIPLSIQKELLKGILSNPEIHVLLNCGFTFRGIEKELLNEVPSSCSKRVTVIPKDTPIDVYAALTDRSDVFITGDTAPLHIAAANKIIVDSDFRFRNATAVVGIFGATSSKIYGYDSFSDEHIAAPQRAPSKVFEVFPECKNITCIDKIFKACPKVRCFDGQKPEPIIDYVNRYLS
ncbi:MAG: glycosyltransferase family 9 protein [Candidatus Aminicenantes bacterium]|nr:MAG: glycosyltransferase family 9 protein [Candidatus Aminicenantes bacterium]